MTKKVADEPPIIDLVDWERVATRLLRMVGANLRRGGAPEDDVDDLVQTTLAQFFESDNHLGFDPRKIADGITLEDGLTYYLVGVAKHKLTDHFRSLARSQQRLESLDDVQGGHPASEPASDSPSPEDKIIGAQLREALIALLPGDTQAIALVNASANITGTGKVDQELADLVLGDPAAAARIANMRKRIRRKVERARAHVKARDSKHADHPWCKNT